MATRKRWSRTVGTRRGNRVRIYERSRSRVGPHPLAPSPFGRGGTKCTRRARVDSRPIDFGASTTKAGEYCSPAFNWSVANWLRGELALVIKFVISRCRVKPDGGAGGGTRTHKDSRPEKCEFSAFTSFATPAPYRLRTLAIPKAKDVRPRACCRPRDECAGATP